MSEAMPYRSSALKELTLARLREFYREPAAVFWVYGFPLFMALLLGIAFQEGGTPEKMRIDVAEGPHAATLAEVLKRDPRFEVAVQPQTQWRSRLRAGRTDLVVLPQPQAQPGYAFWVEGNRAESLLARNAVDGHLLRQKFGTPPPNEQSLTEKGGRYIDFLIPGLIGMNIMGGGLFGVGFAIVDLRVRKLLKRFLATPMKRRDFLLSILFSRLIFTVPEVCILLLFGIAFFDFDIAGNWIAALVVILLGAATFGGIGLLVASRAKTLETASGLINLCVLPMWVLSGVFFAAERFPEWMQPFIQALPLTALNNALRGIMLDAKGLHELIPELLTLAIWGIASFVIALRCFRWQ